jgi:hypothetical protein
MQISIGLIYFKTQEGFLFGCAILLQSASCTVTKIFDFCSVAQVHKNRRLSSLSQKRRFYQKAKLFEDKQSFFVLSKKRTFFTK